MKLAGQNRPGPDVASASRYFRIHGDFVEARPHGSGHINDTYLALFSQSGATVPYVFQRINHLVFENVAALMVNIHRVTTHLGGKLAGGHDDASRPALTLVPTLHGQPYARDELGNAWRAYLFIEGARTYDVVENSRQAYEAARAFGRFQTQLADLPEPHLHETIPDFHHTPKRFATLEEAIENDAANRAARAAPEIEFALRYKPMTDVLLDARLPERVTHNDAKLNNVMLDDETGEGVCVIDLDTVMPGLALYDFGDLVRTTTSPAPEDEQDLSKVHMQFKMFEALARGYLSSAGEILTNTERELLAVSGKLITFEIGIRFLTDFLNGDTYFKVRRPNHNLDRCRSQFKLVESIETQEDRMNRLVKELFGDQPGT